MGEAVHNEPDQPVMTLTGPFADRDAWTAKGWCSIERALEVVGTRSAMILLREMYYGATRFEELVRRTGLSEAVTAGRLKQLVEDGLLARRPYREPGARTRSAYVLTDRGRALFPFSWLSRSGAGARTRMTRVWSSCTPDAAAASARASAATTAMMCH